MDTKQSGKLVIVSYSSKNPDRRKQLSDGIAKLVSSATVDLRFAEDDDDARIKLRDAEILLTWKFPPELHAAATKLRWIQLSGAGADHVVTDKLRQSEITLTNSRGIHGPFMAEWTLAALLYLTQKWDQVDHWRRDRDWKLHKELITRERKLLVGMSALIVGYGEVGKAIADLLISVGVKCAAMSSTGSRRRGIYAITSLKEIIGSFDIVVLAAPLTDKTNGLFDHDILSRMKPGSTLVNVARGKIIDEAALISALTSGPLASAALDVFAQEPLDTASPLFDLPNVFISPHVSGNYPAYSSDVFKAFLANLKRYLSGQPLKHVVDMNRGY